ncbi:hypothetical protein EW026_g7298 [Hermanssonia centrifuga]|uniref:4-coumarate--CoA ligase n=1 Tax=Hermanssonia centrifuga TaxID=98765 RepID=A0A4S4K8H7_9APHY|nr:hypothetical protein EW026_g7298 [Hermanssonia centrifuga]
MKERWNIGDDDVVCISSPNHLDYPVICWATQQLGAIVATVNPSLTSPELGTTGNPKAVAISHYNVIYNVTQIATFHRVNEQYTSWGELRFRPGDTCGGVLPFYHIYGLVVNNIVRYKITHLLIVPPQAMLLCKHPAVKSYDLSHVRFCMVAAAPLSAELTQDLLTIWPDIHLGQGYGMTETCAAVSMKCGTLGSGGQLVSGTEAKIIKADGTLAKRGEPGEIWVKGDQVVLGYFNDEDATRATFVDGWVRTGDEALFAENGDLFVVDRIKEIMKVKGFQVSPSELEGQLLTHPDVSDVGVIGILDDYSGELPVAFVALTAVSVKRITGNQQAADTLKAELMKHVSDAKSRYKWLKAVHFVDAIPRNPSGKILRRVLRQQAQYVEREKVKL